MSVEITRNNAALILHDALQFNKGMSQGDIGLWKPSKLIPGAFAYPLYRNQFRQIKKRAENVEMFTALSLHDGKKKG